jgi:hypothetical protein
MPIQQNTQPLLSIGLKNNMVFCDLRIPTKGYNNLFPGFLLSKRNLNILLSVLKVAAMLGMAY